VSPSSDRKPLQDLSRQHESSDDQSGEEFTDGHGGEKGDSHREFHRHFPFNDVFKRFFEYRVSAN